MCSCARRASIILSSSAFLECGERRTFLSTYLTPDDDDVNIELLLRPDDLHHHCIVTTGSIQCTLNNTTQQTNKRATTTLMHETTRVTRQTTYQHPVTYMNLINAMTAEAFHVCKGTGASDVMTATVSAARAERPDLEGARCAAAALASA